MEYRQDPKEHHDQIVQLIKEYIQELHRNLDFQNIEQEYDDLSQKYLPPHGHLIVAYHQNKAIGCVALHKHNQTRCEMKRLFVKKEYRHLQIGYQLIQKIISLAQKDGYQEMVLDTILPLQKAIHLYHHFGFYEIDAYYDNPMDDVVYMKKDL